MRTLTQTIKRTLISVLALTMLVTAGLSGTVGAVPYDPNGTPTAKTPVFNQFTGVPNGVGDEGDFVRVKPQAGANSSYTNSLSATCNVGEAYTVRTYVHNGADPAYNTENGATAVARNTVLRMTAPLNTPKSTFEFKSNISASNAASVNDNGFLNCGGKTVKLTLVASSVKTYVKPLGFQNAADSAVNGTLKIGSRTQASGDVFACWDDRVTVTYDVKVVEVPKLTEETPTPKPSLGECKLLKVEALTDRRINTDITGNVTNATIIGYKVDYGDGTTSTKQNDSHQYAKDGAYTVTAQVYVQYENGTKEWKTANGCKVTFTVKGKDVPPVVTTTPVTPTTPKATPVTLPATGPASVAAIFTLVSAISSIGYYLVNRRSSLI